MIEHHKLVRDRIPEIIIADGGRPLTMQVDDESFGSLLDAKLDEERIEFRQAIEQGDRQKALEELADMREVIEARAVSLGYTVLELAHVQAKKKHERGGFLGRVFLESVE